MWKRIITAIDGIGRDKLYHFIAGMAIAVLFGIVFGLGPWCVIASALAGAAKEAVDKWSRHTFWDWGDLLATVLGGIAVSLCFIIGG